MKGCTFKRTLPSGRVSWGYSIYTGKDPSGKKIRVYRSGFKRQMDAAEALRKALAEKDADALVKPDPRTFKAFMDEWLREYAARCCTPKTAERYGQLADYTFPYIGGLPLKDLSAITLERLYNRLKDSGGWNRKTKTARPLSVKTVRNIAGVVHSAMKTAVRWKLLKVNPGDAVQLPKWKRKEAIALESENITRYLDAAHSSLGMYEILLLDAATGCRRGELLALQWTDFDPTGAVLQISKSLEQTAAGLRVKSTKSGRSRMIPLPASAVDALKALRKAQETNRKMYGPDYRTDLNLVFCDPQGNYLMPDSITAKACLIARKAGLKGVSLHTLRHSHGSQLLSAGVPLPTVSKRLGHSNVYTTATVYSHSLSADEITAAEKWDAIFRQASDALSKRKPS